MSHDPLDGPPTLPSGAETVRSDTSLEYVDVATGEGRRPAETAHVTVHYRAWLSQGGLVEDTYERGEPAEFDLGQEAVIPALEEGVRGMKVGGRRRLIVPSDLAYGAEGNGAGIPPYATLIMDVELVASS